MEIIPAILTNSPDELKEKIRKLTLYSREYIKRVQIDIVDPNFTHNKTVGVEALDGVDTDLLLDLQLMVEEPINWVEKCVRVGAERIIGHVEQMQDQEEFISTVMESGLEVGLGLDIHTPVGAVKGVLSDVNLVLLMSVEVGFGGQEFDARVLTKISELAQLRREKGLRFNICIDGGVNEQNISELSNLGVDEVALGKSLWTGEGVEEEIEKFVRVLGG